MKRVVINELEWLKGFLKNLSASKMKSEWRETSSNVNFPQFHNSGF